MKKKKVTLDVFEEAVLPMLQAKHAEPAALQAAITEGYEIVEVSDDGTETAVDFKVKAAKPEQAGETDLSDATITKLAKAFAGEVKGAIKAPVSSEVHVGEPNINNDPKRGFKHFGEFAFSVKNAAAKQNAVVDDRLKIKATASTYASEGVGADGGYAVPPEFATEIMSYVEAETSVLTYCDTVPVTGNSMTFVKDETTPWGTDGIQAYWEDEASAYSQTKPKIDYSTQRLKKVTALVPVTEELLQDATALGSYVGKNAGIKIDFKIGNAIFRGNGAGKPKGFLNSGATVSQAKESGQTADTINVNNLAKMLGRVPSWMRKNLVWFVHPDAEQQIYTLTLGNYPLYLPPGSIRNDSSLGMLWGKPVIPTQLCETVGDVGDIILADMTQYRVITKNGGGIQQFTSFDLWFDQDLVAFKFRARLDGESKWSTTITQRDGANTQGPFVTLADRA